MKSLVIMSIAVGIAAVGLYQMYQAPRNIGFDVAKPYYIAGAILFVIGAFINHLEHTRSEK